MTSSYLFLHMERSHPFWNIFRPTFLDVACLPLYKIQLQLSVWANSHQGSLLKQCSHKNRSMSTDYTLIRCLCQVIRCCHDPIRPSGLWKINMFDHLMELLSVCPRVGLGAWTSNALLHLAFPLSCTDNRSILCYRSECGREGVMKPICNRPMCCRSSKQ